MESVCMGLTGNAQHLLCPFDFLEWGCVCGSCSTPYPSSFLHLLPLMLPSQRQSPPARFGGPWNSEMFLSSPCRTSWSLRGFFSTQMCKL